jgi:hypothetical protein
MKSILDSSFRYTPSSKTEVRKTFERIRREQQAQIQEEEVTQISPSAPVSKVIVRAVPEHVSRYEPQSWERRRSGSADTSALTETKQVLTVDRAACWRNRAWVYQ